MIETWLFISGARNMEVISRRLWRNGLAILRVLTPTMALGRSAEHPTGVGFIDSLRDRGR